MRTSPLKFYHLVDKSEKGSISNFSTKVQSGVVPMPAPPVALDRVAGMLEGFSKPKTAGEAAYLAAFRRARDVVAAGFCPIFRAAALQLENDGKNLEASVFWKRVVELLDAVVPGSELAALTATKLVVSRLNAMRLDPGAVAEEIDDALARSHVAYGGGVAVFRLLHGHCFHPGVLDLVEKSPSIALMLELPRPLPPAPPPAAAPQLPPAPTGPGFYEELKRKAAEATSPPDASTALVTPALEWAEGSLTIQLPGVRAASMALEVAEESFRLRAGDFFLEQKVRVDGTSARLKKGVLTLKLL